MDRSSRRAIARLRAAALVLPLLLAAACGSDDDDTSSGDSTAQSTAAPTSAAAETTTATADPTVDSAPADTTADTTAATTADSAPADTTADTTADTGGRANEPGSACIGSGDGSGEPIVVGSIQTDESPAGQFPDIIDGAEACFEAINSTGGIDGRPIEFQRCNDSADAVQGESCARDLIDAGAVAVLGGICFSCFSAPIVDVLGEAGIPYVGGLPVLPPEYEQENFLAITNAGGSAALYSNAAYIMQTAEENGVDAVVVEIYAAVGAADPTLEQQINALGGTYKKSIGFDPASADLASVAQQAIDEDPTFISVQTDGPNTVKLVTNLRSQGYEGDIVILGTAADPESIEGMGDAGEGVYVAAYFPNLGTESTPDAVKFQADMEAVGADPEKALAITGYAGAYVTAEALFGAGEEITTDSVREALLKLDGLEPLFRGDLSYKNANEDFPRTFYFTAYGNVIQDGEIVSTGTVFNFYTGEAVE
jgi:branched-chain amino acid transport system substrate-binding protein